MLRWHVLSEKFRHDRITTTDKSVLHRMSLSERRKVIPSIASLNFEVISITFTINETHKKMWSLATKQSTFFRLITVYGIVGSGASQSGSH